MTDQIAYSLPEARRVLILAPHPDDETIGCGGTIALYVSKGVEVFVVIISDGSKIAYEFGDESINVASARKQEAVESANILGVRQVYFLDFPDGELSSYEDEIRIKIEAIIKEIHPNIIFAPSPIDFHQDHIVASKIALQIMRGFPPLKLSYYEVYNTIRFNTLIDITQIMYIKEKAFLNYKYSLFNCPDLFFNAVKGLNVFRSFFTREQRYYEAFYIMSEPFDKTEIINWLTYGMAKDPAIELLSKLKAVDKLLYENKKYEDGLKMRERELQELKAILDSKERINEEFRIKLNCINNSIVWKLAKKFYNIRDTILPEKSVQRRVYDRILDHIKAGLK